MDKEAQDRLWNELSEESQNKLREVVALNLIEDHYLIKDFEKLFGTHNLNPEPQIKEWKDVQKADSYFVADKTNDYMHHLEASYYTDSKVWNKAIATLKIAKLIELGYGGMVSEEEWKDSYALHTVFCSVNNKLHIQSQYAKCKHFITFHTKQQAEEFMSYESNRKLVEQYYMM